jgi:hypothetical protein
LAAIKEALAARIADGTEIPLPEQQQQQQQQQQQ